MERKIRNIWFMLFVSLLVISLGFSTESSSSTYYVSTSGDDTNTDGSADNPWKTIQHAVDQSSAGDTIKVAAGTYNENVVINKDLTLQGAGSADTIITAPDSPTAFTFPESSKTWEPVVFAYGGTLGGDNGISGDDTITVTISGFTVDGDDRVPTQRSAGILLRNAGGTISGNTVQKMSIDGKETFGIVAYGDSDVTIEENIVSGYARGGIGVNGNGATSTDPQATITGNTVTGPGKDEDVTWAPNGIQIAWGATGEISGNTVSGNGYPGTDWAGTGILVGFGSDNIVVDGNTVFNNENGISPAGGSYYDGYDTSNNMIITNNEIYNNHDGISQQYDAINTIIEYNDIHDNVDDGIGINVNRGYYPSGTYIGYNSITNNGDDGIWIDQDQDENGTYAAEETVIQYNNIFGNGGYGVYTQTTVVVDATLNWWGDSTGPTHDDNFLGVGDAVSDYVDYKPWCANAQCSAFGEEDDDGVSNVLKFIWGLLTGSNAGSTDSDGDGLYDADELNEGTDPNNPDTDGDGVCDGDEAVDDVCSKGPDVYPTDPDANDNGILDGEEGYNPQPE